MRKRARLGDAEQVAFHEHDPSALHRDVRPVAAPRLDEFELLEVERRDLRALVTGRFPEAPMDMGSVLALRLAQARLG